jgi:hypothetical protein
VYVIRGGGYIPRCSDASGCSVNRPFLINDVDLAVGTVKEIVFTPFDKGLNEINASNGNSFYPVEFGRDAQYTVDGEGFVEYFDTLTQTFFSPWAGESDDGVATSLWGNVYSDRDSASQNYIMNIIFGVQENQVYPANTSDYSLLSYPTEYKSTCNWMNDSESNSIMCDFISSWRLDPVTKMNPFNNIDTDIEMDTLVGLLTLAGEYQQRSNFETFIDTLWSADNGSTDNYRDMQLKGGSYDLTDNEVVIAVAVNGGDTGREAEGLGSIQKVAYLKIRKISTPERDKTNYKLCEFKDANSGRNTDLSKNCFSYNPDLLDVLAYYGYNESSNLDNALRMMGLSGMDQFKKLNNERFICIEEPMYVYPSGGRDLVLANPTPINEATCKVDSDGAVIYYPTYIPQTFAQWYAINDSGEDTYDYDACYDQARAVEIWRPGYEYRATKGCYKNDLPDRQLILEVEVLSLEDTFELYDIRSVTDAQIVEMNQE